uniref:Serpentine Receptor, class J n=1 Tax=Panagrellus redivivus TaxID=6233 RepID=A0A7E4V069_PANRE
MMIVMTPCLTTIFVAIFYITGIATFILTPFYLYAVIVKSRQQMSTYRTFMLVSFPFSALTTMIYVIMVPIYIDKTFHFRFYGIVAPKQEIFSAIVAACLNIIGNINTDLLLIFLINRYYVVSKYVVTPDQVSYKFIYAYVGVTNGIECVSTTVLIARNMLPLTIKEVVYSYESMMFVMTAFYQATRIGGFITIVYLNLKLGVKYASAASSPAVVRLHKMLTKTVIANVISTLVLNRFPVLLVIVVSFSNNMELLNLFTNIMSCLSNSELLMDILITMYFVVPYRRFVVNLFVRKNTVVFVPSFVNTKLL